MYEIYFVLTSIFYYITLENENYIHPELPDYSIKEGIIKGLYCLKKQDKSKNIKVQLLASGSMVNEIYKAADVLKNDWKIDSLLWSVTSYSELHKDAEDINRWNNLNPDKKNKISYLDQNILVENGPVIAISDYVKLVAEQISPYINCPFLSLGTDGFGRSETREHLRDFFEVSSHYIVLSTLNLLVKENILSKNVLQKAIKMYNIDTSKPNPKSI